MNFIINNITFTISEIDGSNIINITEISTKYHKMIEKINTDSIINNYSPEKLEEIVKEKFDRKYMIQNKKNQLELLAKEQTTNLNSKLRSITNKRLVNEFISLLKNNIDLDIVDNNLFKWHIQYNSKNIDHIIEITFHEMYPSYPPAISVIKPRLKNNLSYKISNSNIVKLEYWKLTRKISYIIERVQYYIDQFGVIDDNTQDYTELEKHLIKLSTLININIEDICPTDIDTKTEKNEFDNTIKKTGTDNTIKKTGSGTGYGTYGSSTWDIESYIKAQEERDKNIEKTLYNISISLNNTNFVYINDSYLVLYLEELIKGTTWMEMEKRKYIYIQVFNIIDSFIKIDKLDMLHNIIPSLIELYKLSNMFHQDIDILSEKLNNIYPLIKDIELSSDIKSSDKYITELQEYKFQLSTLSYFSYPKQDIHRNTVTRLQNEFKTFGQMLPLHENSSIFVFVDETNIGNIRTLITGPDNTPYDSGIFIFDTQISLTYPNESPKVKFVNHGGQRFNPNLYNCGKVCLSILGTWQGTESEKWNPKTSTLAQIYISVQSLILVEDPYFNEPGFQPSMGTPSGTKNSIDYNKNIRHYTLKHAILYFLENISYFKELEPVIRKHFILKKDKIIKICDMWLQEDNSLEQVANKIKKLI